MKNRWTNVRPCGNVQIPVYVQLEMSDVFFHLDTGTLLEVRWAVGTCFGASLLLNPFGLSKTLVSIFKVNNIPL